jgi:Cu(I)/Ag(I) efflux system membrane fusion protein
MKTKQIIIATLILVLGIVIGKFAFNTKEIVPIDVHTNETKEEHWTCSMHPQIDLPEFGDCPICGMDLILRETHNEEDNQSTNSFKMTNNAMALANIETLIIGKKTSQGLATSNLKLTGKIVANEKNTAIQTAHFGGRIESLMFRSIGEYVSKGRLVATLYSPELVSAQNELIEVLKIKNTQPELYNAVRNKLKNWKITEKQIQQIERTKKAITNFQMYANVSGYITEILVEEGNHVKEGTPLFKVTNLTNVWAEFDVYEQNIHSVKIGQELHIQLNAYQGKTIQSKIDYIDPILNMNTRTVKVRATLQNSGIHLKPGMLITSELKLKTSSRSGSIEVPKTAVLWTGKRSVLYVKVAKDKPVFEMREVSLGADMGMTYQILSGIENGEEVVVNGTFTVDAAAQLQGKKSMMNQTVNKIKIGHEGHVGM